MECVITLFIYKRVFQVCYICFYKVATAKHKWMTEFMNTQRTAAILAGATAGLCVDLSLYPLDTIKTRLQGATTLVQKNGQLRLFAGLPAVLFGSAPGAALFFFTYEFIKATSHNFGIPPWMSTCLAASIGELSACFIRVPCEIVKQRAQSQSHRMLSSIISEALHDGGYRGIYRGYFSTISRELPFALIQYPVWEFFKYYIVFGNENATNKSLTKMQSALCGALAGGIAGACTTPLDVAKTRIMVAQKNSLLASGNVFSALTLVYSEAGIKGCFAGLIPRVSILSIGGAIFLGLYDITKQMWTRFL